MIMPRIITLLFALLSFAAAPSQAADSFDIDLKELQPAKVGATASKQRHLEIDLKELRPAKQPKAKPAKRRHKLEKKETVAAAKVVQLDAGNSRYTMKAGDQISQVLVRYYGVSGNRARDLMHEVIRINGIKNPDLIAVGRQLIIPLPLPSTGEQHKNDSQPQVSVATAVVLEKSTTQPVQADVASQLNVKVRFAGACALAREVSEKLGLLHKPTFNLGGQNFTVRYDAITVAVACDPTQAEVITYERLLAKHGERVLVLRNGDSGNTVVEKLAEYLGLSYRRIEPVNGDNAPETYVFSGMAEGKQQEIGLTIEAMMPGKLAK